MNKMKILVVEDDKAVCNLVTTTLETQGYAFFVARTGQEALLEAAAQNLDMIILDLGLPDMDGVEVIRKVRMWSLVPIIVMSARSEDDDKINALDMGADDYLTKPFNITELLARLRATMRRMHIDEKSEVVGTFRNGSLEIDYVERTISIDGKAVHLTPIEYKLLSLLSRNIGKVLTHNFILKEVWGNVLPSDTPSLRVFMATLRKKIEAVPSKPQYIQTHVGIGYRMLRLDEMR